jgi:hypothetical protein
VTGRFDWMSDPQYLAQVGHFLGGLSVVFTFGVFFGSIGMWVTLGLGLSLAALKEFGFDTASWGENDSWADSAMDFGFYALGGLSGTVLSLLAIARHAAC